jgi:hypothetical protein
MSPELLEILAGMDLREMNTQMALQCAPVIMDIKISNLLIVDIEEKERVKETFCETAISFYILYMSDRKVVFLIYDREKFVGYLRRRENQRLLRILGYHEGDPVSILMELSKRYQGYMQNIREFPHELGIMLGYPVEDVMGFIVNRGQNPLFTGYWKVYDNPWEKLLVFEQYRRARELVIRLVAQGISVKQLLNPVEGYSEKSVFMVNTKIVPFL